MVRIEPWPRSSSEEAEEELIAHVCGGTDEPRGLGFAQNGRQGMGPLRGMESVGDSEAADDVEDGTAGGDVEGEPAPAAVAS